MSWLSQEAERELLEIVENHVSEYIKAREIRPEKEILTQKQVLNEFGLSPVTLYEWEKYGLKRLQSPYERTNKVYYLRSEIYRFLTVR